VLWYMMLTVVAALIVVRNNANVEQAVVHG
jgi:hypothetical protein